MQRDLPSISEGSDGLQVVLNQSFIYYSWPVLFIDLPFIFSSFQDTSEDTEFSLFICVFSTVCHFMYLHFLALSTKSTIFRQNVVCDHVAIKYLKICIFKIYFYQTL